MASPRNELGRDGGDRAIPDAASRHKIVAPDAGAAADLRAWLIGLALDMQRTDAALIALKLAGWPR